MEIIPYALDNKEEWNKFCFESNDAWFWHNVEWIEYTLNYDPKASSQNLSFFVKEKGKTLAICPLILEVKDQVAEFAFGGNYTPLPAFKNDVSQDERINIAKEIFSYVDSLAWKHKVKVSKFKSVALDENFLKNIYEPSYPLKLGFLDVSIATQVLDLSASLEDLKKDIRHGHKSDITKAQKNLTFEIYDKKNVDGKVFREYEAAKMAHGSTRPRITFDLMLDFIKKGEGFLVLAKFEGQPVSYSYFFVYKNNAYYGSSVNLTKDSNLALSHGIQWQAMQYMKKQGIRFYEIGWQVFAVGLNDFSSQKEVAISKFKRGFGGKTLPLFMAEKYYDKSYLSKIWSTRLKNVEASYE